MTLWRRRITVQGFSRTRMSLRSAIPASLGNPGRDAKKLALRTNGIKQKIVVRGQ